MTVHLVGNNTLSKTRAVTYYELPPEGISLLGYVVRRMHKTHFLVDAVRRLKSSESAEALALFGLYGLTASVSFGPAFYQPSFDEVGESFTAPDPETGANVTARLNARTPSYHISYTAELADGSTFAGQEEILGTSLGFRGIRMPAPADIQLSAGHLGYTSEAHGLLTTELYYRFAEGAHLRGHGTLEVGDSEGNYGHAQLRRDGVAHVIVHAAAGGQVERRFVIPAS
jgi:hypothetical protein